VQGRKPFLEGCSKKINKAGLLTFPKTGSPSHPIKKGSGLRTGFPASRWKQEEITVAGPFPICTGFPFKPNGRLIDKTLSNF
jgi:hypothetical protein